MESLNRIELKGVVGYKRMMKVGDRNLATFSVATTYGYKDIDGGAVMETTWHLVRAWGGNGITEETLEKIHERTPVSVTGRLRAQRYTDNEGNDRTTYEVIASKVEIMEE